MKKFYKISYLNYILLLAVIIRIVVLIAVIIFQDYVPAYSFMGSYQNDDYRYEQGAILYSETAKNLIDYQAFTAAYASLGDYVGYRMIDNPMYAASGWYLICCFIMFITKFRWSIRVLNIILMVSSIKIVYRIMQYIGGEKAAVLASKLLAFLPYPVIMSCFSYKECMAMFTTFYIWLFCIEKKNGKRHKYVSFILLIFCIILLVSMKRGMSIIIISFSLLYLYWNKLSFKLTFKRTLIIGAVVLGIGILIYIYKDVIYYMMNAYILSSGESTALGGGRLVLIRSFSDFWKLPITFLFSIITPIGLETIESWASVVSTLNIVMCPVAVGGIFDLFYLRKTDIYFYLFSLAIYIATIITSILIYRQCFYLLPLPIMMSADFYSNANADNKFLAAILSGLLVFLVFIVW